MKKSSQRAVSYGVGFLYSAHPYEQSIPPTQHIAGGY